MLLTGGTLELKTRRRRLQKRGKVARTHRRGRTRDSLRGARARWRFKSAVCGVKARASDLSDRGRSRRLPLAGLPNPRSPILFALVVDNTARRKTHDAASVA